MLIAHRSLRCNSLRVRIRSGILLFVPQPRSQRLHFQTVISETQGYPRIRHTTCNSNDNIGDVNSKGYKCSHFPIIFCFLIGGNAYLFKTEVLYEHRA